MTRKQGWEGKVHGRGVVFEMAVDRTEFTIGVHAGHYREFRFNPDTSLELLAVVRDEDKPGKVGRLAHPYDILYYSIAGWRAKLQKFIEKPGRMRQELMALVRADDEVSALVFEFHRFRNIVLNEYNARDRTMPNGQRKDQTKSWRPSVA